MADFNQGAQGALGGAATGASLGALGGPLGAGIGAGIGALGGGLLGMFGNSNSERDRLLAQQEAMIQSQFGLGAPQLGGAALGSMGGDFRSGQLQLIGQLQQQAAGLGPSLADQQFNRSLDRGVNSQVAASQAGTGNAALQGRAAANAIGNMTQDLAGQAAQARIQEQLAARNQLAGVLGQGRGQELQGSQFNAGAINNQMLAQADLEMRNRALQNQLLGMQAGLIPGEQPGFGTQLLSGGGSMLANAFGNKMFNFGGGAGPTSNPIPQGFDAGNQMPGFGTFNPSARFGGLGGTNVPLR